MSNFGQVTETSARAPSGSISGGHERRFGLRRRVALGAAIVVLGWSVVELVNLIAAVHMNGPELYGVLVAALAVLAAALGLRLLRSPDRRLWATVAVLGLWAVVGVGGIAGAIAHIVGPAAGHGPVDLRERPIVAPLIFTAFAVIGGIALWFGQRSVTMTDPV